MRGIEPENNRDREKATETERDNEPDNVYISFMHTPLVLGWIQEL